MVSYICSRCNYITNDKNNFRRHLNRKFPCKELYSKEPIFSIKEKYRLLNKNNPNVVLLSSQMSSSDDDEKPKDVVLLSSQNDKDVVLLSSQKGLQSFKKKEKCDFCSKEFSNRQNKHRHMKRSCKVKKEQAMVKYEKSELEELKKEIEELKKEKTTITNNNMTNSHNTQNTQNNITINNFGKENIDYITYKDIKKHLSYGPYGAIRRLIQLVHYNKKHPENHNIAITNKKSKYGSVKKDDVWQLVSIKDMLNNLIETKFEMITEAYHSNIKDELDGFKQSKYEKFFEKFEYDEDQVRKFLDDKIQLMLMNCTKLFKIKPK